MASSRRARRRGEYGIRRRNPFFLPRWKHDVLYLLRPRSGRPSYRRDLHIYPKQRQMGKRNPCDDRKRLGYRPRSSFHLAGRQIPVFRIRRRGRFRWQGYFPCPGSGKRFRPDGEPRRRDQHPGRRDVPICPGFRHPLFRVQRTSGNGRSRSVQGHAGQYREVEGREPRRSHQLYGRRFRYHLRRKRGTGLLLLQPQRRTGL